MTARDPFPPMGGAGPVDPGRERVAAFLEARFGPSVAGVERIGQGQWSTAWAFRLDGRALVARFAVTAEDFGKDRLAARFATPDLPIPAMLDIGEAFGGFFAVSERVFGGFLDDLDEAGMRRVLPALLATLDAARRADLSGTTGYGSWGADGNAPHPTWRDALLAVADDRPGDRTHGWRERLRASPTGDGPFEAAYAALRELADRGPVARCLIHGDLLNFNVLVADGRIAAVIDWGGAMAGDVLYDLAWFLFWQPWYPAWRAIDLRAAAERHHEAIGLQAPARSDRLRCCQIHIGLAAQAYHAFKGEERWGDLAETARRTLAIANGTA